MKKQSIEHLRGRGRELADAVAQDLERQEQACEGLSLDALASVARMALDNFLGAASEGTGSLDTWVRELCALMIREGWRLGDLVAFNAALRRRLVDAALEAGEQGIEGAVEALREIIHLGDTVERLGLDGFRSAADEEHEELRAMRDLLECAVDGVAMANLDGVFTYANPAMRAMLGRKEIEGVPLIEVFEDGSVNPAETTREVLEQGKWDGVLPFVRQDGSGFQGRLTIFPVRSVGGKLVGTAAIVRDVTEEREMERLLQLVVDHVPAIMYVKGLDHRYLLVNKFAADVMNLEPAGIIGKADHELFPPAVIEQWREREARVARGLAPISFEDSFEEKDGRHTYLGTLVPVLDAAGDLFGYGGISTDITDLRRSEEARVRLQEELLVAHKQALRELSTPIIPIADELVVMPLIGPIDSNRAKDVQRKLIEGIVEYQATFAILDLTGVSIVDSMVASSLLKSAQAARLLGAEVLLTGIKPQVAQVMVQLGVDLQDTITYGSLKSGVAHATRSMKNG